MNLGDVFNIRDNQLRGVHVLWALERNKENNETSIPGGTYYIQEKRGDYYIIGRIFNEGGFQIIGQKDSYYVHEDYLKNISTVNRIKDEDILIAKTVENMIEQGKFI